MRTIGKDDVSMPTCFGAGTYIIILINFADNLLSKAHDGSSFNGPVPAQVKEAQIIFNRLIMALFGGIALIGPTIIMTLHSSKNTCLITTSVATFIFAVVLAIFASDSSGKDVLGATAAYAAVLVVFIGTSLSAS
jgi:hypothetical protein